MISAKYVSGRRQTKYADKLESNNLMERDQLGLSYNIRMCHAERIWRSGIDSCGSE